MGEDADGVTKHMFASFWSDLFRMHFEGSDVKFIQLSAANVFKCDHCFPSLLVSLITDF
jgi:hypothetical protein